MFEGQFYFDPMILMRTDFRKDTTNIIQNVVNSMCTGMAVYILQKDLGAFTKPCLLRILFVAIELFMSFNNGVLRFGVLAQPSDSFMSLKQ